MANVNYLLLQVLLCILVVKINGKVYSTAEDKKECLTEMFESYSDAATKCVEEHCKKTGGTNCQSGSNNVNNRNSNGRNNGRSQTGTKTGYHIERADCTMAKTNWTNANGVVDAVSIKEHARCGISILGKAITDCVEKAKTYDSASAPSEFLKCFRSVVTALCKAQPQPADCVIIESVMKPWGFKFTEATAAA